MEGERALLTRKMIANSRIPRLSRPGIPTELGSPASLERAAEEVLDLDMVDGIVSDLEADPFLASYLSKLTASDGIVISDDRVQTDSVIDEAVTYAKTAIGWASINWLQNCSFLKGTSGADPDGFTNSALAGGWSYVGRRVSPHISDSPPRSAPSAWSVGFSASGIAGASDYAYFESTDAFATTEVLFARVYFAVSKTNIKTGPVDLTLELLFYDATGAYQGSDSETVQIDTSNAGWTGGSSPPSRSGWIAVGMIKPLEIAMLTYRLVKLRAKVGRPNGTEFTGDVDICMPWLSDQPVVLGFTGTLQAAVAGGANVQHIFRFTEDEQTTGVPLMAVLPATADELGTAIAGVQNKSNTEPVRAYIGTGFQQNLVYSTVAYRYISCNARIQNDGASANDLLPYLITTGI